MKRLFSRDTSNDKTTLCYLVFDHQINEFQISVFERSSEKLKENEIAISSFLSKANETEKQDFYNFIETFMKE